MNTKVDEFINNATRWQNEIRALRVLLLEFGLAEDLKWKQPCYTFNNNNLALIARFKDYCAISFLKGVLLKILKRY